MVTYETLNMLFQAFTAFATMATAIIALIVLYTNKKSNRPFLYQRILMGVTSFI